METKGKSTNKSNIIKWYILVSILLVAIIGSGVWVVITNSLEKSALTSASSEENIVESSSLENFEAVENKTEEELKELNEKEIKKTEDKQKNNKKSTTKNAKNKYYIKVNYGAQVVTIYTYDSKGNYTVPVKAMVCSTGTETPRSGVYKTPVKLVWCHMFGNVWAHYCTQIVGNILFHSVPFLEKNNHTLEYWEYDKLGTKASMGCIRLTTRDAKWLFDNVPTGTSVEFYSSSNPGPLGKPSAPKISGAPSYLRGWDPTDPDPNNPWKNYNPQKEDNSKNENTNTEAPSVDNTNNENNQSSGNNPNVENNQGSINDTNTESNQGSGNSTQGGNVQNNESSSGNNQNSEATDASGNTNSEVTGGNSQNNETTGGESKNNETTGGNNNNEVIDGDNTNTENSQGSQNNANAENNQNSENSTQSSNLENNKI